MNLVRWVALLLAGFQNSGDAGVNTVEDPADAAETVDITLVAYRLYSPSRWYDDVATFAAPVALVVPDALTVTVGNAGNRWAHLYFSTGAGEVRCRYRGGASTPSPSDPAQIAAGLSYTFNDCADGSLPGDQMLADAVTLHVHTGDQHQASTEVVVIFSDVDDSGGGEPGGGPPLAALCDDGSFGRVPDPGTAIAVASYGDDAAAGTTNAPFRTLARALDAARALPAGSPRVIAVGPGSFPVTASLANALGDSDTEVYGCGTDATTLTASVASEPVFSVASSMSLSLSDLSLEGGTSGASLTDGAKLNADSVVVSGTSEVGLRASGSQTALQLTKVDVVDPVGDGACEVGVRVDSGTLVWSKGSVQNASGFGVLVRNGVAVLDEVGVVGTRPDQQQRFGRGVQIEGGYGVVRNGVFLDNTDASIFAFQPRGILISGIAIDITGAGLLPIGGLTGDGVVVVKSRNNGPISPSLARVLGMSSSGATITNNRISRSARAAFVLEDVDGIVSGNKASGSGIMSTVGTQFVSQGKALISGSDASAVTWLAPQDALAVDLASGACALP